MLSEEFVKLEKLTDLFGLLNWIPPDFLTTKPSIALFLKYCTY